MSTTYFTLCDFCADKMDASKHSDGTYYMEPVEGSRGKGRCMCGRTGPVMQYQAESKAQVAARRAFEKQKQEYHYNGRRDRRARYREPWRNTD